jgi:hypothetical protein
VIQIIAHTTCDLVLELTTSVFFACLLPIFLWWGCLTTLYAHLKLGFEFAFPLETSNEGHPLNEQPVSLGHLKIGSSNAFFVA